MKILNQYIQNPRQTQNNNLFLYGLPRSGTWLLETLLVNNFFFDKRKNYNKHILKKLYESKSSDFTIVIYKNPYKWIESIVFGIYKKYLEKNDISYIEDWWPLYYMLDDHNDELLRSKNNYIFGDHNINFCPFKKTNYSLNLTFDHKVYYFDPKKLAFIWKYHFNNFVNNSNIIFYEELLKDKKGFMNSLNLKRKSDKWIFRKKVPVSETFNKSRIQYYLQNNYYEYLNKNHLRAISDILEPKWLKENTIYKVTK